MEILYLITTKTDETIKEIIRETMKDHTVRTIKLYDTKDYDEIIDAIEQYDKVISW